jgi:hypothetical protein
VLVRFFRAAVQDGDANNAFTKEGRTTQNEYFDFTAKLFTWRKTKTAIHTGK